MELGIVIFRYPSTIFSFFCAKVGLLVGLLLVVSLNSLLIAEGELFSFNFSLSFYFEFDILFV